MLKIVIIDDETDARSSLRSLINTYCPDLKIVGEAHSVSSGVALIRQVQPQLVLLDIKMSDGTGFHLLDKFSQPSFRVIFITAYDDFALKAFKYNAIDYILKPIDTDELIKTIDNASQFIAKDVAYHEQVNNLIENTKQGAFEKLVLPASEGLHFIKLEDIIYLQSEGNYTQFHTQQGEKILVSKTIKSYEEILPPHIFYRIHQSYVINITYVKKYLKEDGGYALLESGVKVPISRRKKEGFLELLVR